MIDYPRSQPTRDPDVRLWREAPHVWRILVRIDGTWAPQQARYARKSDALATLPGQIAYGVTLSPADVAELRSYLDELDSLPVGHSGRSRLGREVAKIIRNALA